MNLKSGLLPLFFHSLIELINNCPSDGQKITIESKLKISRTAKMRSLRPESSLLRHCTIESYNLFRSMIYHLTNRPIRQSLARGFTLIELMVVVVIMGILASLVVPKLLSRTGESKIAAARVDISTIMQALKLYKLDNQRYPTTEQGLQALVNKPTTGPAADGWKSGGYLEKLPKDPWGNPYQYLSPGIKSEVDVFSLGADGQAGGTGDNADIGSWDI